MSIPFTGWSTQPTSDWLVNVLFASGHGALHPGLDGGLGIETPLGVGTKSPCYARQAMNNGVEGTLSVAAPASAAPGDFAVLEIRSYRENPAAGTPDAACYPRPDDDISHVWYVGVYVP